MGFSVRATWHIATLIPQVGSRNEILRYALYVHALNFIT